MALVVNDRVKETSTTTGTVTFTLDGAVAGFETFSSAIGNSNTTYYAIEIPNSTEFEVGLGTVSAGQLARTQVFSSSNSDALVDFSAGTKNVFCTLPASKAVIEDASNNVTLPADLTVGTDTFDVDSTNEKVNIGTTSGAYTGLNVYKKSGPGNIYVHLNGNPGTIIGTSLLSEGASGAFIINTRDDADIRIYTNNTLRSEFKNNGNFYVDTDTLYVDAVNDRVGIGGIPTERLTVIGPNNSSAATLKVKDTDGRGILISSPYSGSGVGHIGTDGTSSALGFKVNGTEYARFSTNGYFGIGTTNPSSLLHLSSSDPQITITDTDGTGSQVIKAVGDDFTIDAAANITLDVGGANGINLYNDNGPKGRIYFLSDNLNIKPTQSDTDLVIKGNDGGAEITALTLDMSEAGAATFNSSVTVGANLDVSSGTIKLDGNYPTGTNNVAMGDTAFDSVTTGADNTVIGSGAGTAVTTGQQNTVVGSTALNTGNATGNTAIGFRALRAITGANNVGIGRSAGHDASGGQNTFVGGSAGYYINGTNNVAVGYQAGNGFGTTGSSNIFMGYRAGDNITNGSNNIIIGTSADASSATASNEITLGNSNVTSLRIPGLASGASSGDVLTYDGTDITLSAPTGVTAGFVIAMSIAL